MKTVSDIVDFVGRDAIKARLRVGDRRLRAALQEGRFPALWYDELERMAGRPLDRRLFSFRRSEDAA